MISGLERSKENDGWTKDIDYQSGNALFINIKKFIGDEADKDKDVERDYLN